MSGELPRVRASALSGWADCPRRSAARLFRKEIEAAGYDLRNPPNGIGACIGTAVHAAAALTLREKAERGSLAPIDAVTDCAVEIVRGETANGVTFDDTTGDGATAEKQCVRMARAYQASVAPDLEPVLIEELLEADTPFGVILTGHADLVAREPGAIDDLKTSVRMRGYHAPQIGAYSLLSRTAGLDVQRARIDHLQRVSLRVAQPPIITQELDVAAAEGAAVTVLAHIARSLKLFREGDPACGIAPGSPAAFLANPNSALCCSAKYNPAFGTNWCRECSMAHPRKA